MSNINLNNVTTGASDVGSIYNPDGTKKAKKASDAGTLDKDAFLKLMVAQLKYQSPDSSVDTNQFMAQTAQMSQLESLQNIADSQATLLSMEQNAVGTSMIGANIKGTNSLTGTEVSGVVTGILLGKDGPTLKIGDTEVALSSVKEVNRAS